MYIYVCVCVCVYVYLCVQKLVLIQIFYFLHCNARYTSIIFIFLISIVQSFKSKDISDII